MKIIFLLSMKDSPSEREYAATLYETYGKLMRYVIFQIVQDISGYVGGFQDEEYSEGMAAGTVGGQEALLFSDATESRVCWGDSPHFIIEGMISIEDALKYASTVSYVSGDDKNKSKE